MASKMKQIHRIAKIIKVLKEKRLSAEEIKSICSETNEEVSIRQIQRDINDVSVFLNDEEYVNLTKENKTVYYCILKKQNDLNQSKTINDVVFKTKFYTQIYTENMLKNLSIIEQAVLNNNNIIIQSIKNDETGDNANFVSEEFSFYPLQIINHRETNYIGGWNPKKKLVQIFGVNQLVNISQGDTAFSQKKLKIVFENELKNRFGVTKNINEEVYNIKIEMSTVLADFIKSHYWHESQKFTRKNNIVILHLKCGINRELMGWLFQWLYNIRILEPKILEDYYHKTVDEIQKNSTSDKMLVYRNLFEEKTYQK
jgi:predicted DNA-binding transcriptional regulator YafY